MGRNWFRQRELGNALAIGLIRWIALRCGRRVARGALYPITAYFLLRAGPQRRASRHYLARVMGRKASLWQVARHIHTFAATLLDRIYLLSDQHDRFDIRLHRSELISDQVAKHRGCILLGSHLGSFEVLRALALRHAAFTLKVLMYRDHNQTVTRMLEALNPEAAETVIELSSPSALLRVQESLQQGDWIGMLGDRLGESGKVCHCRFLGEYTAFPCGPVLLSASLKVPVILFFGLYRGGNRYDVYFEQLAGRITVDRNDRHASIQKWMQRYADRLEYYLRLAPYNWFNFYDYWQDQGPQPKSVAERPLDPQE
jgi:predicted LPLAT superfamily acyltransferase